MTISDQKLKKLLVAPGHMREVEYKKAKRRAENDDIPIEVALVEDGFIKDQNLGRIIADEINYDFVDLKNIDKREIAQKVLKYISEVVARAQRVVIFDEGPKKIKVATSRPENYTFFKILEQKTDKRVDVYYSTPFDIDKALREFEGDSLAEIERLVRELEESNVRKEQNTVELVDAIMEYANRNLASDIHIEPLSEDSIIRFRVDGVLHKVASYPKKLHNRVASRIKIMAKLRTDEKDAAQDGRFEFETSQEEVDVRVSIMPTTEGENIVMRLLMQEGGRLSMNELGLLDSDLKKMKRAARKPYGMIMVVGPTGSGKSTTLYSVLQHLKRPEVNIMTIEDPTEYNIEGVQQTQVNPAKGITFPKGLRSIVRQDPDVIMVGEIRDEETVDMALNSAMTGHLVLSTMHANDSATTFPRFLEMDAEPFLVATSVNVTIAQRLVRTICPKCKKSHFLPQKELDYLEEEEELAEAIRDLADEEDLSRVRFYKGSGCDFCKGTGYSGRMAIFEVLEVTEEIRKLISEKRDSEIIRRKAIEQGMNSMVRDGVAKALIGKTTLESIRRSVKV